MFSNGKKNQAASARQSPANGRNGGSGRNGPQGLSFIGPDVVVSGDVTAESQIHIDGRVDGNVRCDILVQGKGGTVAGNIVADQVRIAGFVDGTVRARLVDMEPSARVTGDVTYETLSIAPGAEVEGRLSRQEGAAGTGETKATGKSLPVAAVAAEASAPSMAAH